MASSNLTKIDQAMLGAAAMFHRLADRGHRQALLLRIEQEGMRAVLSSLMIEHEPLSTARIRRSLNEANERMGRVLSNDEIDTFLSCFTKSTLGYKERATLTRLTNIEMQGMSLRSILGFEDEGAILR